MSITVGVNSWVTVAEADTYLTDRIGATDWFLLADTGVAGGVSKESLLITAFNLLLGSPFVDLSPSTVDGNVQKAQIEFALFLLSHYTEYDERSAAQSTGLSKFTFSKRTEEFTDEGAKLPQSVDGLLSLYATGNTTALLKGEYDV